MVEHTLTLEEKMAKVKDFRPIDDVFFEVLAANKAVCEEIIRTIIGDKGIIVEDVVVQSSERNLYGRSVRLDALCVLSSGKRVNIEVQRSDNDEHLKRARFNSASITVKDSNPGDRFQDVIDVYIIYISEFDFLGEGLTTYHIDKVIRETGTTVDDGSYEIFVNTANNDGTEIGELMSCFTQKEVHHPSFPALSQEVSRLKTTEGGTSAMCEVMRHYEKVAWDGGMAAGMAAGMAKGMTEGAINTILSLFGKGFLTISDAAKEAGISEEEFEKLLHNQ